MVVGLIAFLFVGGFSLYFQSQNSSLTTRLANLEAQKKELLQNAKKEEPGVPSSAVSVLSIKMKLAEIEKKQLEWSKIIEKINSTMPKIKETGEPIVNFRSYNGNEEGKFSVSATTRKGAPEPYSDIAELIRAFNAEETFQNVFVPSINKSLTPEGDTVLSFSINFNFKKQTF